MPRDCIDIGPTPPDEQCEQAGPNYDSVKANRQMNAYIRQLRRVLGPEPEGAALRIKSHPHDFGSYSDVVCYYDTHNEASADYAFKCESEGPLNWDDSALIELSKHYPEYLERLEPKTLQAPFKPYGDIADGSVFVHHDQLCVKYDNTSYAVIGEFKDGACEYKWPKKDEANMLLPIEHELVQVKVITLV